MITDKEREKDSVADLAPAAPARLKMSMMIFLHALIIFIDNLIFPIGFKV